MDLDLTGKTALVTGGSLGLGRAMAEAFHGRGANVALIARREDVLGAATAEIDSQPGGKVGGYPCDVTDPAAIDPGGEPRLPPRLPPPAANSATSTYSSTTPANPKPGVSRT